jgi:ParB family chromosome partitioning protein
MAQSTLSNKLRLLRLNSEQRRKIYTAGLTERHARAFIRLPEEMRDETINRVIAEQLNVNDTEELVSALMLPKDFSRPALRKVKVGDLRIYFNSISKIVDTIRSQGVDAYSQRNETEDFIEYTITIPKVSGGENKLTVI